MLVRNAIVPVVACWALFACGSEPAPEPVADVAAADAGAVAGVEALAVTLSGGGLMAGGTNLAFSTERAEVEKALGAALGEPESRDENGECGAGPMQFTNFKGGLTANFQQDRLVGWYFDTANPKITLANGITIGTARERITSSPEFMLIPESTLGEEFALGEAVGGFLDGDKVGSLYAGVNCFFR